jgi:hypothetical protein
VQRIEAAFEASEAIAHDNKLLVDLPEPPVDVQLCLIASMMTEAKTKRCTSYALKVKLPHRLRR